MAYCPKCKGLLDDHATVCPHCHYDFPVQRTDDQKGGLAYSPLADIALAVAAIVSAFLCITAGLYIITAVVDAQWLTAFVYCPVAMLISFALVVVFIRVDQLH